MRSQLVRTEWGLEVLGLCLSITPHSVTLSWSQDPGRGFRSCVSVFIAGARSTLAVSLLTD